MNYGLSQMARGRYEVALDYFERAGLTDYGEHPYVYVNPAIANNGAGNTAEVASLFLAGIERGPGFSETHYHYARRLVDSGRIEEALPHLDTALTLRTGHEPSLIPLSEIQALSNQPLVAAKRAAAEDPSSANLIELSLRYYEAGRYDDGLLAASRAVAIHPRNPLAHNNVCAVYNATGQFDLAIVACSTALESAPDYESAQETSIGHCPDSIPPTDARPTPVPGFAPARVNHPSTVVVAKSPIVTAISSAPGWAGSRSTIAGS